MSVLIVISLTMIIMQEPLHEDMELLYQEGGVAPVRSQY